jgi:hypothetical protein
MRQKAIEKKYRSLIKYITSALFLQICQIKFAGSEDWKVFTHRARAAPALHG